MTEVRCGVVRGSGDVCRYDTVREENMVNDFMEGRTLLWNGGKDLLDKILDFSELFKGYTVRKSRLSKRPYQSAFIIVPRKGRPH